VASMEVGFGWSQARELVDHPLLIVNVPHKVMIIQNRDGLVVEGVG